jgi:hypothetical protein
LENAELASLFAMVLLRSTGGMILQFHDLWTQSVDDNGRDACYPGRRGEEPG